MSCFLSRTPTGLHSTFKKALENVSTAKTLQVPVDGPNVNFKFLRGSKEELTGPDETYQIIDVGSYGLHVVSGTFKAGRAKTDCFFAVATTCHVGQTTSIAQVVMCSPLGFVQYCGLKTASRGCLRFFPT